MPSQPSNPKPKSEPIVYDFEAIGTVWHIEIYDNLTDTKSRAILTAIVDRIDIFDTNYSRFRDDSLVTEMAQRAGNYELPDDAEPMFELYRSLYDITAGQMTPLIGQALSDAGYDADYSLRSRAMTSPPAWEKVLDYTAPTLVTKEPVLLDFGAAGKGNLIDIIGELLRSYNIEAFCIDAGGDIVYKNPSGIRLQVALEHPDTPLEAVGIATILDQAICGSSGNRRTWGEFHHIISPTSLTSPRHIKALWVVADTGLLADGLATALFFVPAKKLSEVYTFEYAIVYADLSLEHSDNFPAEFFN